MKYKYDELNKVMAHFSNFFDVVRLVDPSHCSVMNATDEGVTLDDAAMNRLIEVLDRRINGLGVAESLVQKAGSNRVIIELPGISNTEDAIKMIGKT